jgi:hypothetical protein
MTPRQDEMSPGNTTATQPATEPTASAMDTSWLYPRDSEVVATVRRVTSASLAAYREQPLHLEEHLRVEADVASGAYFSRQVYELVQNAADAILEGGAAGRSRWYSPTRRSTAPTKAHR